MKWVKCKRKKKSNTAARSRSIIWHRVMCVLNSMSERGREKWTDFQMYGGRASEREHEREREGKGTQTFNKDADRQMKT